MVFSTRPVVVCVAVTSAPGTTAPEGSVTVPLMLPYPCASMPRGAKPIAQNSMAIACSLNQFLILGLQISTGSSLLGAGWFFLSRVGCTGDKADLGSLIP